MRHVYRRHLVAGTPRWAALRHRQEIEARPPGGAQYKEYWLSYNSFPWVLRFVFSFLLCIYIYIYIYIWGAVS